MPHYTGIGFTRMGSADLGAFSSFAGGLATAEVGGTRYAYVSAGNGAEIQVYEVAADGALNLRTTITDTAATALYGASEMQTFSIGTSQFLAVAGQGDDGVSLFRLSEGGAYLTHTDTIFESENAQDYALDNARHLSVHQVAGTTYLIVSSALDTGTNVIEVVADGSMTWLTTYAYSAYYANAQGWPSDGFELDGNYYFMMSGSPLERDASLMNLDPGHLQIIPGEVQMVGGPLGYTDQSAAIVVGNIAYLFVVSAQNNTLSVASYTGGTSAPLLAQVTSPTRLDQATTVQVYETGDQILVAVGSYGEAGIQIFEFDPAFGTLTPTQWLAPSSSLPVDTPIMSDAFDLGGVPHMLVASDGQDELTLFAIGGGDDIITASFLPDFIEGFAGDDIIFGLDGADSILPGLGDDVVFAGSGDDYVIVSEGRDDLNGGDGHDTVDARNFIGAPTGVTIDFLRGQIILPDGTEQALTGFEEGHGTEQDDVLIGDYTDDVLLGMGGNDLLRGREGNDTLEGGDGDDLAYGASGNDQINLGAGADRSNGGDGADVMRGGAGNDRLFGGAGEDYIEGGNDDDLLRGNDGDDFLAGGGGNDILIGQQGDDRLVGGSGDNFMQGGGGRDTLTAGRGNDDMTGGSAIDTFVFDPGSSGIGVNIVRDFQNGLDLIDLTGFGFANVGQVLARGRQTGADVEFDFGAGQFVTLANASYAALDATDFLL